MAWFYQHKRFNLYIALYILHTFAASVAANCYAPNGDIESDPIFQPCGGDSSTTSMCCATNRTNPSGGNYANGYTADICLENGLCENKIHVTYGDVTTLVTLYYRDYCTSSNWTDGGGCLDVCTEQTNPDTGVSNSTIVMTPCDGTANSSTWCCGDSSSCCGSDSAISIAQTLGTGLPTTTSSTGTTIPTTTAPAATPTTTTSTTTTQSSISRPSSPQSPSPGLSSGAKAGIGLGVSLGCIGIVTLALSFIILRRRRARWNEERRSGAAATSTVPNKFQDATPQEKPDDPIAGEMPAIQRFELPSQHT